MPAIEVNEHFSFNQKFLLPMKMTPDYLFTFIKEKKGICYKLFLACQNRLIKQLSRFKAKGIRS